ncbi:hypothetical protein GCM10027347_11730 [Larkinella harenae]
MLTYSHFLMIGLGTDCQASQPVYPDDNNYLQVTFAGHDTRYTSLEACRVAHRNATRLWYISLGADSQCFLSIALCGNHIGTYPFGNDQSFQPGISLVTYGFGGSIYSSYSKTALSPRGEVSIEEWTDDRSAKGRFSGVLTPQHGQHSDARSISGRFHLHR